MTFIIQIIFRGGIGGFVTSGEEFETLVAFYQRLADNKQHG
jgi:hypothetical protein